MYIKTDVGEQYLPRQGIFLHLQPEIVILKFSQGSSHSASLPSSPPSMLEVPMAQESLSFTYLGGARAGDVKNREKLSLEDTALFAPAVCLSIPPLAPSFLCTLSLFLSPIYLSICYLPSLRS